MVFLRLESAFLYINIIVLKNKIRLSYNNWEFLLKNLAMDNATVIKEVARGYRLEKPRYPGEAADDKLKGIYGVR